MAMAPPSNFFWRRIRILPDVGVVAAGLEDDVHRFRLRIGHRDGLITDVDACTDRIPYSTCAGAGPFLADRIVGLPLTRIATLDAPCHCTHLLDLAVLAARYADAGEPICFDMRVADRVERRTRATLHENGVCCLVWDLVDTMIQMPPEDHERDLRLFGSWCGELCPIERGYAAMLRRAVMVSGSRALSADGGARAGDRPGRFGACFTHQRKRQHLAVRSPAWRKDFSAEEHGPLQDFLSDIREPMRAGG